MNELLQLRKKDRKKKLGSWSIEDVFDGQNDIIIFSPASLQRYIFFETFMERKFAAWKAEIMILTNDNQMEIKTLKGS